MGKGWAAQIHPFSPNLNVFPTIFYPPDTVRDRKKNQTARKLCLSPKQGESHRKVPPDGQNRPSLKFQRGKNMILMFFFHIPLRQMNKAGDLTRALKKWLFCPIPSYAGGKKRFLLLSGGPAPKLSFAWLWARTRFYVAHSILWGLRIPSKNMNKQLSLTQKFASENTYWQEQILL